VVHREDDNPTGDGKKHVWSLPISNLVKALMYRKDLFFEAGLDPARPPKDWDELMTYARKMTDPDKGQFGMQAFGGTEEISWGVYNFLVSTDARAVAKDDQGKWRAAFGTRGCAEAIYYIWTLAYQTWERDGKTIKGAMKLTQRGEQDYFGRGLAGMAINYLNEEVLSDLNPQLYGIAPVPLSPMGTRGSEVNCEMLGIFSDSSSLQKLAIMEFIWYFTGEEAQRIRTQIYVENGMGLFVSPVMLKKFGYDRLLRRVPKGWQEAFTTAMTNGVPEPYGKNTQNIYRFLSQPINEGIALLNANPDMPYDEAIDKIYELCVAAAERVNVDVLGELPPEEMQKRRITAVFVLILLVVAFAWMMVSIWRYFTSIEAPFMEKRSLNKYIWGYLLIAPGILLVMWWQYLPLVAGLSIAFMDFQLVRESVFKGVDNFAMVLFDERFWMSMWRTLHFVLLMIGMAFWPPILLAILLQEVPTNTLKYVFRTVYYLPQVLAGVIVYFLWFQLFDASESGVLNQLLVKLNVLGPVSATIVKMMFFGMWSLLIFVLFALPVKVDEMGLPLKMSSWLVGMGLIGVTLSPVFGAMTPEGAGAMSMVSNLWGPFNMQPLRWLQSPEMAMLCLVIPTVWATAGPGCILYLAALKTVPDELYEAADIDGASNWHKVFYIVLPRLKYLIMIQFIAAVVAAFKGGAEYVLIMTGGGPKDATNLLSLEIFRVTFMDLKYGIGTAMAWLLGGLLIGFTAYQLRLLSRAEFKAGG
jgi:multiple sugar transport system permease protein